HGRVGRQSAQSGGAGKSDQPQNEDLLSSVNISESSSGDQTYGVGQAVPGYYEFDLSEPGVERGADAVDAEIGDKKVDDPEQWSYQHHGKCQPTTDFGRALGR